jgi:hypothetical protein
MTLLTRIAERVINRPLLVHPDKLPIVLGVLEGRIPLGDLSDLRRMAEAHIDAMPNAAQTIMRGPHPGASRFVGDSAERDANGRAVGSLPYRRTSEGVAVITITGSLINRGAWVGRIPVKPPMRASSTRSRLRPPIRKPGRSCSTSKAPAARRSAPSRPRMRSGRRRSKSR